MASFGLGTGSNCGGEDNCNSPCGESMGLGLVGQPNVTFNRKFRWIFSIRGSGNDPAVSVLALPPRRASRPIIGWKEYDFQHLTETIFYPMKPAWEPIDLTLYDARCCDDQGRPQCNPIFTWIRAALSPLNSSGNPPPGMYNPQNGFWRPIVPAQLKRTGDIYILGGAGGVNEHWVLDNCYPQHVRWGELDMDSSDIMTVEVSIRYDRAYCVNE